MAKKATQLPHAPVASRHRRRSSAADPLKKVTLRLRETVTAAIRALVESGGAPSADAFIEEAVVARFRERRQQRVYAAYAEAAADPAFMADMELTNAAFDAAVGDGLSEPGR